MVVVIRLQDKRAVGIFLSREDAVYWCKDSVYWCEANQIPSPPSNEWEDYYTIVPLVLEDGISLKDLIANAGVN